MCFTYARPLDVRGPPGIDKSPDNHVTCTSSQLNGYVIIGHTPQGDVGQSGGRKCLPELPRAERNNALDGEQRTCLMSFVTFSVFLLINANQFATPKVHYTRDVCGLGEDNKQLAKSVRREIVARKSSVRADWRDWWGCCELMIAGHSAENRHSLWE